VPSALVDVVAVLEAPPLPVVAPEPPAPLAPPELGRRGGATRR
jgi:hypothetical protein